MPLRLSPLRCLCMSNKQSCERLTENKNGTSRDVMSRDSLLHKPSAEIKTFPMIGVFTNWCSGGCCPHHISSYPNLTKPNPLSPPPLFPPTQHTFLFSNCSFVERGPPALRPGLILSLLISVVGQQWLKVTTTDKACACLTGLSCSHWNNRDQQ